MSLREKCRILTSDIYDDRVKFEIISTIMYLFDVYSHGRADEESIREDLYEVITIALKAGNPTMEEDEVKMRASVLVDEFIASFKLEGIGRRLMSKYLR